MKEKDFAQFQSRNTWSGRSLTNYIINNPKAKGAKTLTEARRLAFGAKPKSFSCKCGQHSCKRDNGGSPHC